MKHHWWLLKLWRFRVTGLLLVLGVTSLTILLSTYFLKHLGESKDLNEKSKQKAQNSRQKQTVAQVAKYPDFFEILRSRRHNPPPVVFLKTHKTGSSTVQNLLFRMGEKHGATFAFPSYSYQFSYPDKFEADFVDELPEGSSQFDILCSHMRLNMEELKKVMPPNTIYITILRDPVQTFESVFSYYTFSIPAFSMAKEAAETMENRSALSVFLGSPESFWDPKSPENGLGKNPMSFDFGLDLQHGNMAWSANLTALVETFHLIMIAEHFDESLVLLRALLKLKLEEIRAWNHLDMNLYDFSLKLFQKKVEEYGAERLKRDVDLLRASSSKIRQKCVASKNVSPEELEESVRPWQPDSATILGYSVQGNLTKEEQGFCMRLVLPELQYHAHLMTDLCKGKNEWGHVCSDLEGKPLFISKSTEDETWLRLSA
uniref:Galactose-3-O-sulfotransferase 4 n=1 Tax=Oryzias latipes TaxID=8090 RepID=A0A3P9JHN4_ORYLA